MVDDALRARFWQKVDRSSECWTWTAVKNHWGYGRIMVQGKARAAHRVSYLISNGPVPAGMCVLHTCDNPPCVNPSHLFLGTLKDNMLDMVRKGRGPSRLFTHGPSGPRTNTAKGESHGHSFLREADVREMRALRATGLSYAAIARRFGIHSTTARDICVRQRWKHVA